MDIVLHIWVRLLEKYAEQLFFQNESSGVFSFLLVGVLAYLYKQEKEINKRGCSCCQKQKQEAVKENNFPDSKEEAE
ncbi:hypothetical protein FIU87_07995 [Bacillus sp. THAF10]|uniref:hypothetical protein n=1 Tax=Bacillus sp. THAF10 TaxID=2587848 RepID=UPI0012691F31|nr:hypothetical protein [Bacillus sp. THAF10]QFT88580.1 hypothetical protein FIU87_07995 [Bacillus sp. THAF10]